MKFASITILISAPDDTTDRALDKMIEAYEDLDIPELLQDIVELNLDTLKSLKGLKVSVH